MGIGYTCNNPHKILTDQDVEEIHGKTLEVLRDCGVRFEDEEALDGRGHQYDVSADGERFVLVETVEESSPVAIHVAQNWFAEFQDNQ